MAPTTNIFILSKIQIIETTLMHGFSGSNITYGNPQLAADTAGNVLFYVNEDGRAARVSPVINNTQLAWGAMGRRTGSGTIASGYYNPDETFYKLYANRRHRFFEFD